jgi:enolase
MAAPPDGASELTPDRVILDFIERARLSAPGDVLHFETLPGGVSSDIWIVRAGVSRTFCVKRARARLQVAADWQAPVSRNSTEVAWLKQVAGLNPDFVPAVLASDAALGLFAMEYLPPAENELWKTRLARGVASAETADEVGRRLASVHAAFARSATAAADFDTGAAFHALRLEPYLLATARVHTDLAPILNDLAEQTARTKVSVVHGDISPKNILLGRRGPKFLDAECAWFGDPAFDLAFCLNHLLLKTLWVPSIESDLLSSFDALVHAYLRGVDWESPAALEARAARLLPALLLARVDGKSPVEYLTAEASKDTVRRFARETLKNLPAELGAIRQRWGNKRSRIGSATGAVHRIERVVGRRIWDSRGRPTVEAEVFLTGGVMGRAMAPAGASTSANEAIDLRDGGAAFGGLGVDRAVRNISSEISQALRGLSVMDQEAIDRRLIELDGTPNKARLGGNATVAVSMAVLHAAATARGVPLWRYVAGDDEPVLPMPMVQIFGGGAHARQRVDIQDFLIIPVGASTFDEAISMAARVYDAAGRIMAERGALHGVADEGGWWPEFSSNTEALETVVAAIERARLKPGVDAALAIDVAATQLRKGSHYRFAAENRDLSGEELAEILLGWCRRYPIASIEDPLAEDDHEGMRAFTASAGRYVQVVGDDYLVTSADRIAEAAASGACNAVLLKPNQVGTITETSRALAAARTAGWSTIVSARSGETEDVTIVHLAVGWAAGQLKVGSCARSERTAKWNEALRIEQALGDRAVFGRLPVRTTFDTLA